ncbi:MAG: hypothetical protein ACK55I_39840, partial [bacterium]
FRPGHGGHVAAVFVAGVRVGFAMRFVARLDDDGDGVTDHGSHLRHEIACLLDVEGSGGGVALRDLLPALGEGGRVPALELEEVGMAEDGHAAMREGKPGAAMAG